MSPLGFWAIFVGIVTLVGFGIMVYDGLREEHPKNPSKEE